MRNKNIIGSVCMVFVFLLGIYGCNKSEPAQVDKKNVEPTDQLKVMDTTDAKADPVSLFEIGKKYFEGVGVQRDVAKAQALWEEAAKKGSVEAFEAYKIAIYHPDAAGLGNLAGVVPLEIAPDVLEEINNFDKRIFNALTRQETTMNPGAEFILATLYEEGKVVKKDTKKAIDLYLSVAASGNKDAQYILGYKYLTGDGVPRDLKVAAEYFEKGASASGVKAYNLGQLYHWGDFGSPNFDKAVEWYGKAAELGYPSAYRLAEMYYKGNEIPQDKKSAVIWYEFAAQNGDRQAQQVLGKIYYFGDGVPRNIKKAIYWLEKSSGQGDGGGEAILGLIYSNGESVDKDLAVGYAWLNIAGAAKFLDENMRNKVITLRDKVAKSLTSSQQAESELLVEKWKPGHPMRKSGSNADSASLKAISNSMIKKVATATGFNISTSGHVVTNYHVVKGCSQTRLQGEDGSLAVLARDEVNDLALLQRDKKLKSVAKLSPYLDEIKQGQDVVVYGYPLNSVLSSGGNLTPGIVSALTGLKNNTNQIQITAPIQPGSSGSPVFDRKGHVVGVVNMKLSDQETMKAVGSLPQNVNFAINGITLKGFLDANNIDYEVGYKFISLDKDLEQIAKDARDATVLLECWN